jgi:hypothetical protein
MSTKWFVLLAALATALLWAAGTAMAATQAKVNVANPDAPFPPNKSAEAAIAIDQHMPNVVVAGAFDEVDEAPCGTAESTPDFPCPFVSGVGVSGVYFSWDRGQHWFQPSFTGWTARNGTPHFGTIHTLPWYYEEGIQSDADSAVAIGPRPQNGNFSWDNGSRVYYANLTSNFTSNEFKAFERIAVSRMDNPTSAARVSNKQNWFRPVLVPSKVRATTFEDKEQIWADNAESSPFFGNVYLCFADYRSVPGASAPLVVATSRDGGSTWTKKQVSPAHNVSPRQWGQSGCTVRTTSDGTVYVFFETFQSPFVFAPPHGLHQMVVSDDGGRSWSRPIPIQRITNNCALVDPVQARCVEDGVAGARTDLASSPSVDIANGAPSGADATDEIVMSWTDMRQGPNNEKVMITYSTNGGRSWAAPRVVPGAGRAFYSAPAISPDGDWMYLADSWFQTPLQMTTSNPRWLLNTFKRAPVSANGTPGSFTTLVTTPPGDARGGSANGLGSEFLGDYNYASAARDYGVGVWTADARNAVHCAAVDAYRQALVNGDEPLPPNPADVCPGRFGNIDIWSATSG